MAEGCCHDSGRILAYTAVPETVRKIQYPNGSSCLDNVFISLSQPTPHTEESEKSFEKAFL